MKKRFIAIILVCAMCLGFAVQASSTDTNYMATVGGTTVYSDTFSEVATEGAVVTLLKNINGDIQVDKNIQLDLNGKSVSGTVTVNKDVTLQVSDSATADFDISDGIYGTISVGGEGTVEGAPATATTDAYLPAEQGGKLSFHAVDVNIDTMALKIEKQGLYFNHTFKGDSMVKNQVAAYGILLSNNTVPNEDDLHANPNPKNQTVVIGDGVAYTYFTGEFGGATSTLITGIMKEENGYLTNKSNANRPLYGRAYIKLTNGEYVLGVNRQRSLRQQIEIANQKWDEVNDSQKKELLRLYRNNSYNRVLQTWSLTNLETYMQTITASATTDADKTVLDGLYAGRTAYHGEMHDHAKTGGSSDGNKDLATWKQGMDALKMDFATILDHRQALHMDLADWDDTYFIGGSEASCLVTDRPKESNNYHYDMVFADKEAFERVLYGIEEFDYKVYTETDNSGKWVGEMHFRYPNFTTERFNQLIDLVKAEGGYFSIAHPGQSNATTVENALDMYYQDYIGFMVFYGYGSKSCDNASTQKNYQLWTAMLAAGKRVWAAAGNDLHNQPQAKALTTIYSEGDTAQKYLDRVRVGDYTAGFAGIRMAVGDTVMGSTGTFEGERLVFSVGDFYESMKDHTFTVSLIDDIGTVFTEKMSGNELKTFAIDADENARFYRVEVYDQTDKLLVALGNPIWNSAFYQD